ncbi:MAG: hypothetical protein HOP96_07130, partial [Sphingomonas sp.]|nr:hypothetical protein [Sphingomonas sp.]
SSVDFTSTAILPLLLDRLRFLLFALTLLLFPDGKWRPGWALHVAISSLLVFLLGILEAVGVLPTKLFLPLAIACVVTAIGLLVQRFRTTADGTQRLQLKWVALGLVSGVGLILLARSGAALSQPRLAFEAMFQVGIVLVALGFLVPLLKYRLYDAESVISRSAGYAVLTVALVAVFAGSEAVIENLGQQYLGTGIGQISGAMAAAVAAVLLAPLNERISGWAERRFQRDLVQLKTQVPELLADVPLHWSPRQIGAAVLPQIREALHATSAAILFDHVAIASDGMAAENAARCAKEFPLKLPLRSPRGEAEALLLVGPRPDKTSYGRDEVEALREIVPALRRALLTSRQREKDRRTEANKHRALRSRLAQLSEQLAALEMRA